MFADKEKVESHQSYVERKHDFPGMVTSFFFHLFTVHHCHNLQREIIVT